MALCSGHHGELGRRETSQRGALEAREPTHYHRRLSYPSCSDNPINLSLLQIVCKHFIDAIETQKFVRRFPSNLLPLTLQPRFGWFWECPNGGEKCQYRHALPPGFVLKSQRKALEDAEKANTISLEEFLEVEVRAELSTLRQIISGY